MAKNQRDLIIDHGDHLLEYGSGGSSLYFCRHLEKVTSLEHSRKWYTRVAEHSPDNHEYLLFERDKRYRDLLDGKCGEESPVGLKDYLSYTTTPDMILIDGVARNMCLMLCRLRYPGIPVFLHDGNRDWYDLGISHYSKVERIEADEGDYPPLLLKLT